jgi:hypothetical protein
MTHKYAVGALVKMTNCYGITNEYIVIKQIINHRLSGVYYDIGVPLKSKKIPKRIFKSLVSEEVLSK